MSARKTQAKGAKRGGAKKSAKREAPRTERQEGDEQEVASTRGGSVKTAAGSVLPRGAVMSPLTATGQALHEETKEIPQGEDRGSKLEIDGDIKPDSEGGGEPQGLQAEPARFAVNGSVPPNTVPSPSGPVPIAAVAATPEDAQKRLEEHQKVIESQFKNSVEKLSEAKIGRMSRSELQAVAFDRGYDIPQAGSRVTRTAFKRAQDQDQYAVESKE